MHNVACSSTKWPDPFCFLTLSLLCPFYPLPPFPLNPFSHILPSPPRPSLSLLLSLFTPLLIASFSYPFPSHPSLPPSCSLPLPLTQGSSMMKQPLLGKSLSASRHSWAEWRRPRRRRKPRKVACCSDIWYETNIFYTENLEWELDCTVQFGFWT